tara:strand:+ start:1838 stop:2113 length:276 start_codon:yes stop_codon:yes gene_type:complete
MQDEQVRLVAHAPTEEKRWQEEKPQVDAERLLLVVRRQLADVAHQRVEERQPADAPPSAVQLQSEERQLVAEDLLSAVQHLRDAELLVVRQ